MKALLKNINDILVIEDQRNNTEHIVKYDEFGKLIMLTNLKIKYF